MNFAPNYRFVSRQGTRANPELDANMTIDYKDVLDQAVANERYRVLREIRATVERMKTTESDRYSSYSGSNKRYAQDFKDDVLKALDAAEGK